MATHTVDKIEYNSNVYVLQDSGALQLTGGQVTGPVTFGDSISVDEATMGDLVVNGNASFTNNIQANTINGIAVGSSPSFIDTKVTQTESNNNEAYEILFSETADNTTKTEGTKKNSCLKYNPSSHALILSGQLTAYSIFSTGTSSNNGSSIKQITASENNNYIELKTYNASSNTTSIYVTPTKLSIRGNSNTEYISVTNAGVVKITGLSTPVNNTDAVTKEYVDDNIPTVPSNIVNTITTTAGAHTAITSQKGNVSFNVPTTAAHVGIKFGYTTSGNNRAVLQDSSGNLYVTQKDDNTDTKVSTAAVTSGTTYYPVVGADTTSAATKFYDKTGIVYKGTNGTTSAVGSAILTLGNSTASGTANNKQGQLILYGSNAKKATITVAAPSADIALALPTSAGTLALTSQIPAIPTSTQSATTGITASTTATKTTLGTAFTIPNVTSAGSASTWAFEEVSIPNVTSAGSASTWAFEDIACDDITSWSAGSGSASISGAVDSNDSTQLNITISHTHTAPSLQYTARTVSSKKSGANSTAPTLGTAIKVQSKKSGANGSAPTLGTAFTVPNVTGNTSATVSITDPGHTHSI